MKPGDPRRLHGWRRVLGRPRLGRLLGRAGSGRALGRPCPGRIALLASAIFLAGCGDSSTGPELEIFIEGLAQDDLVVGDQVQLQATLSDPSVSGTVSWSSTDTAVALVDKQGYLRAQRPGAATISVKLQNAVGSLPVTVIPRPGGYTADEIDYLQEVAFGFEFGTASEVIRKWEQNPRVQVHGSPTTTDTQVLNGIISELNLLMEEAQVELVDSDPSVDLHFAPVSEFPSILPGYVSGNDGFFSVWFDQAQRIYRSVVLISADQTQPARNHLMREEITQMLGLARDSYRYQSSIFYQGWTTTQSFASIDEALIEMLYRPQLLRGWEYREAVDLLRTLTRRGWEAAGAPGFREGDAASWPDSGSGPWRAGTGRAGVGSGGGNRASRCRIGGGNRASRCRIGGWEPGEPVSDRGWTAPWLARTP